MDVSFQSHIMASLTASGAHSCIHEDEICDTNETVSTNAKDLKQNKEIYCNDEFIVCHDAHHGVGHSIDGIGFSCVFSFQLRKNVTKESRMRYLKILYDSMTKRVDDAYNDLMD